MAALVRAWSTCFGRLRQQTFTAYQYSLGCLVGSRWLTSYWFFFIGAPLSLWHHLRRVLAALSWCGIDYARGQLWQLLPSGPEFWHQNFDTEFWQPLNFDILPPGETRVPLLRPPGDESAACHLERNLAGMVVEGRHLAQQPGLQLPIAPSQCTELQRQHAICRSVRDPTASQYASSWFRRSLGPDTPDRWLADELAGLLGSNSSTRWHGQGWGIDGLPRLRHSRVEQESREFFLLCHFRCLHLTGTPSPSTGERKSHTTRWFWGYRVRDTSNATDATTTSIGHGYHWDARL